MSDAAEISDKVGADDGRQFSDDQRTAEGVSPSVYVDPKVDWDYREHNAFETRWAQFAPLYKKMRVFLSRGETILNMIYTYRCCSKCLPQVRTPEQENRNEIYQSTVAVLEPEVKKMKELLYFQQEIIDFVADVVDELGKKEMMSETMLWYLVRIFDLLCMLDFLKNTKSSLNNDFSAYKRAAGFLRKNQGSAQDETSQENSTLYIFLANPNSITIKLCETLTPKENPGRAPAAEKILIQCAEMCNSALEHERYVMPTEKHCLLRALPYILGLLYTIDTSGKSFMKNKNIPLATYAQWFKRYPVLPVYSDMQLPMDAVMKRMIKDGENMMRRMDDSKFKSRFDEKAWNTLVAPDPHVEQQYLLADNIAAIRQSHDEYLEQFAQMVNELRFYQASKKEEAKKQNKPEIAFEPVPIPMAHNVLQVVLRGLKLVSDWTSRVLMQAAWKLNHPEMNPNIETDLAYERAVKLNYKPQDRSALIEVIAMTKGLTRLLVKEDTFLSPAIRTAIHAEVQEFVQFELAEMFQESSKKSRTNVRNDLTHLRHMVADWLGGFEPIEAKPSKKSKSSSAALAQHQFPRRNVGPSRIQLEFIRDIVYGLMNMRKEVSSSQVKMLDNFYQRLAFYQYLVDMSNVAMKSSDMGELWFREFYLELSNTEHNKRMQFPISMSLPSILVDHVLDHPLDGVNPELLEYALFPLDIYNDAANRALSDLHQQFLYSEIEAEVNLCFDQMLYKLSNQVYSFYKIQASKVLIDKPYLSALEIVNGQGPDAVAMTHKPFCVPKCRFHTMLAQRHVQLLGRTVDLNRLISQRVNKMLRQNVDYVISRFEASDLSAIVELEILLTNIRMTHQLLSQFLHLDTWDLIMRTGNENCSLGSYHNRILLHVLYEVATDFAPHYNFNNVSDMFYRGPCQFVAEVERDSMPKQNIAFLFGNRELLSAYTPILDNYRNTLSVRHIVSIIHLLGRTHLPMLVNECLRNMDLKIKSVVAPYVTELVSGLPKSLKLTPFHYGTKGCHGNWELKLNELITYPDLKTEVFRHFKEMGNILVLLLKFDQVLKQHDLKTFAMSAAALGITPETVNRKATTEQIAQTPLINVTRNAAEFLKTYPDAVIGTDDTCRLMVENAMRADMMYRQPEQSISLFSTVLRLISSMIDEERPEWCGYDHKPTNGVIDVEGPYEFYRFWCALQFVLCLPQTGDELQNLAMYGDGINWAACTIIHLLGQRYRFETFSLTGRTLDIEDAAQTRTTEPNIVAFIKNALYDRELNAQIFSTLETYLATPSFNSALALDVPSTLKLHYFMEIKSGDDESRAPASPARAPVATPVAAASPELDVPPAPVSRAPAAPPAPAAPAAPAAPPAPVPRTPRAPPAPVQEEEEEYPEDEQQQQGYEEGYEEEEGDEEGYEEEAPPPLPSRR